MDIGVGVLGIVRNEKDEVLMQLRSKKSTYGLWGVPGGKIEKYETAEEALIREYKEELDVDIEIVKFIQNIEDISLEEDTHWIIPTYEVKIKAGEIKNMEPQKHMALGWFHVENIPNNITNMTRQVINKMVDLTDK